MFKCSILIVFFWCSRKFWHVLISTCLCDWIFKELLSFTSLLFGCIRPSNCSLFPPCTLYASPLNGSLAFTVGSSNNVRLFGALETLSFSWCTTRILQWSDLRGDLMCPPCGILTSIRSSVRRTLFFRFSTYVRRIATQRFIYSDVVYTDGCLLWRERANDSGSPLNLSPPRLFVNFIIDIWIVGLELLIRVEVFCFLQTFCVSFIRRCHVARFATLRFFAIKTFHWQFLSCHCFSFVLRQYQRRCSLKVRAFPDCLTSNS